MSKRLYLVMCAIIATAGVLAGCGGGSSYKTSDNGYTAAAEEAAYSNYDTYDMYEEAEEEYAYDEDLAEAMPSEKVETPADGEVVPQQSNRKLIRTVNISAETRDFDTLVANVNARITQLGGYTESSNISGNSYSSTSSRTAYIVARIPSQNLDSFIGSVEKQSNILSKSESANDVTLEYTDAAARKKSLQIEQDRLFALLEQADTLESIIALESRLTEVRYEIESIESRLRNIDNKVDYSTVNLDISEVKEYKPEPIEKLTFGQRLGREFSESCEDAWEAIQDFIIGFIAFLPRLLVIIIILAVFGGVIFGVVKLFIKLFASKKSKNDKKKMANAKAEATKTAVVLDVKPETNSEEGNTKDEVK